MIRGIDVASYQPQTFPTSGLDFVFVKATEGTDYLNPHMARQAATARTAGLPLGFYHFLHPGNVKAQAAYFVAKCASLPGDMLVCDWETGDAGAPSEADKNAFIREVKTLRASHRVGLYCNVDFWKHHDTTSYCGDFLWIADPSAPDGHPSITHKWTFHQTGVSAGTDRNVGNFASRAALKTWCGYPTPKPAPPKTAPTPPKPAPAPALTAEQRQDQRITALESRVATVEKSLKP